MSRKVLLVVLCGVIATAIAAAGGAWWWYAREVARVDAILAAAREACLGDDPQTASRLYGEYLAERPTDAAGFLEYATLVSEPSLEKATLPVPRAARLKVLVTAVRLNPDQMWLKYRLGEEHARGGRQTPAIELLSTVSDALETLGNLCRPLPPPGTPAPVLEELCVDRFDIELLMAASEAKAGRERQAFERYSALVGFDPVKRVFPAMDAVAAKGGPANVRSTTDAYIALSEMLQTQFRDRDAAGAVLRRATEANPADALAWYHYALWQGGWQSSVKGDAAAALQSLKLARSLAPENPMILRACFSAADVLHLADDAAEVAARGMELDPSLEWVHAAAARVAQRKGDPEAAVETIVRGLTTVGAKANILPQSIVDLPFDDRWNAAVARRLDEILAIIPGGSPHAAVIGARRPAAEGRWLEAERMLEGARSAALPIADLKIAIELALGRCHGALGDIDLQIADYERALEGKTQSVRSNAGLAIATLSAGQTAKAEVALGRLAEIPPGEFSLNPGTWRSVITAVGGRLASGRATRVTEATLKSLVDVSSLTAAEKAVLEAAQGAAADDDEGVAETLARAIGTSPADPMLRATAIAWDAGRRDLAAARARLDDMPPGVRFATDVLAVESIAAWSADSPDAVELRRDVEERADAIEDQGRARETLLRAAAQALAAERWDDADRLAARALERDPDDLRGRMTRFESTFRRGDADAARPLAEAIAALVGTNDSRHRYADSAIRLIEARAVAATNPVRRRDLLAPARAFVLEIGGLRPNWPEAQRLAAEIEILEGNTQRAIVHLSHLIELRPGDSWALMELVRLLHRADRVAEADRALARLGPEQTFALGAVAADVALRCGRVEDGVALAKRLAESAGPTAAELVRYGQVLSGHGETAAAEAAFRRAREADPTKLDAIVGLVTCLARLDETAEAERVLAESAALLEGPRRTLLLAEGDDALGRSGTAAELFRQAIVEDPEGLENRRRAAEFFTRSGQGDAARAIVGALMRIDGTGPEVDATRAWARRRMAEFLGREESADSLRRSMDTLAFNRLPSGLLSPEDSLLKVGILAGRSDSASWRQAVAEMNALEERQPLTIGQQVLRATLLDRIGMPREACQQLERISQQALSPETEFAHGRILVRNGDVERAQARLLALRRAGGSDRMVAELECRIAMARGDRAAAVEAARRLVGDGEVGAGDLEEALQSARLMEEVGFRVVAESIYRRAAAAGPGGLAALVDFLARARRPAEAIESLAASYDAVPADSILDGLLEALRAQRAAVDDETLAGARALAARLRADRADPVAMAILDAELLDPADAAARRAALRDVLRMPEVTPIRRAQAERRIAEMLLYGNEADDSLLLITSAIDVLGPLPDLLETKGRIVANLGNPDRAVPDLREAALSPTPGRLALLAAMQRRAGDRRSAEETLDSFRKRGFRREDLGPEEQRMYDEVDPKRR